MSDTATMHIDGASRGNPGRAAYAVVLARPGRPPVEEAETMGTASNNVAEYTALVRGLELAAENGVKTLQVFSDSELMVKQMAGEYRVKSDDLRDLYEEAVRLRRGFDRVTITHVRREQNKRADELCNLALDGKPAAGKAAAPARPAGGPAAPPAAASDARVREDALAVLRDAARAWAEHGVGRLDPALVWGHLWSVLEEAGVLKRAKK